MGSLTWDTGPLHGLKRKLGFRRKTSVEAISLMMRDRDKTFYRSVFRWVSLGVRKLQMLGVLTIFLSSHSAFAIADLCDGGPPPTRFSPFVVSSVDDVLLQGHADFTSLFLNSSINTPKRRLVGSLLHDSQTL